MIANTILSIIIGSVFYQLDETADSLQRRSLLLFFALMVNAFVSGIEVLEFLFPLDSAFARLVGS